MKILRLTVYSMLSRVESVVLQLMTVLFLMYSCTPSNPPLEDKVIRQEVAQVFDQYLETVNSGRALDIPTYFSDDDGFYWVEDGLKVYGDKESMIASLKSFTEGVSEVSMQIDELTITPISNEVASLFTAYDQRLQFENGFELVLEGAITITLIKERGTWKFLNGHSSTKKPRAN